MASNWFRDLDDDDFFSRPSRLRLFRTDPWGSLERLHDDLDTSDIFSDFAAKAASLRSRVAQGRLQRESPVKKNASRRASEQSVDGVASPTPSSLNSAAFNYQDGGRVSFPTSSCSNVSDCSDKSAESICTEKSTTHSAVSEVLVDGGEQRKVDSTESWVERNAYGGVVGEGSTSETVKTEIRPGSVQEYSKQQRSYVGGTSGDSVTSMQTCEEISSQTSSSKTITNSNSKFKQTSASPKQPTDTEPPAGKPFRVPPNRSVFYDELDSSLLTESILGERRRERGFGRGLGRRPLDRLASLVDEVVNHDRLFQTELDFFMRERPKLDSGNRLFDMGNKDDGINRSKTATDELKRANEALQQENSRLQQVLQEVTAVNKRWQRYNNDRRMYVQKLLATIQDLQEQMNHQGEAALQKPARASCDDNLEQLERVRRQHEEHTQLLRLQIKSHKDDWEVERREKKKAVKEKEALAEEVMVLRTMLEQERSQQQNATICSCGSAQTGGPHIASQDFTLRNTYQTSFQVPYSPAEEMVSSNSETEMLSMNIVEQEDAACTSTPAGQPKNEHTSTTTSTRTDPKPRSLYLGYPDSGLGTIFGFPSSSDGPSPSCAKPYESTPQPTERRAEGESVICPNCSRVFPPSLHVCFLDHFEFCKGTDTTNRFPLS